MSSKEKRELSRRQFLRTAALGTGVALLAACQPKVVEVERVVTQVVKETVETERIVKEAVEVEKEVTRVVEKAVQAPSSLIILRSMGRIDRAGDSGRQFNQKFMQIHPEVVVQPVDVPYAELPTKGEAMYAAGNLPDVMYGAVKWYFQLASKGVYLAIGDYAEANWEEDDLADIFPLCIKHLTFEGELYGLPESTMPGPRPLIKYNKDMMGELGIAEPPLYWDLFDWSDAAIAATDPDHGRFGTNYHSIGNFYDFDSFVNNWGIDTHIVKDEVGLGKRFNFVGDPDVKEATEYMLNLAKSHAMPLRGETPSGLDMFAAGRALTAIEGTYGIAPLPASIGGRFEYGLSIWKGPKGGPGTGLFIQPWCGGSQSKDPEWAYKLMVYQTSTEAGIWQVMNEVGLGANGRESVWTDEGVLKKIPLYAEIAKILLSEFQKPFPHPWNLRFSEFQDTWLNVSEPMWYLDEPYETQAPIIQQKCQEIMDLPRS